MYVNKQKQKTYAGYLSPSLDKQSSESVRALP